MRIDLLPRKPVLYVKKLFYAYKFANVALIFQ